MKNKRTLIVFFLTNSFVLILFVITFAVSMEYEQNKERNSSSNGQVERNVIYTDIEEFSRIPVMEGNDIKYGEPADYGDEHYVVDVEGTTTQEYLTYLELLERNSFIKHSDNGECAMEGYVMTTSFTKNELTVTVSHVIKQNKTYISVTSNLKLSEYLMYTDSFLKNKNEKQVTKFHNLELNNNGNGFIFELKNGHFVIFDGGSTNDTPYFWDYLISLVPEGEKPIIEGWFISHAHDDHYGVLLDFASQSKYKNNIIIDGIYFCEPTDDFVKTTNYSEKGEMLTLKIVKSVFDAQDGGRCGYYRPQLGQRYYFCDIYIDVCLTPEQFPLDSYIGHDFNDTSIWLMVNIEGQKMLVGGDTSHTGMRTAMKMYDKKYFTVDIYVAFHHGINVYDYWTDYITFDTLIYPSYRDGSITNPEGEYAAIEENKYLQSKAKEYYSRKNGTVVLSFPYEIGTAVILDKCNWDYNANRKPIREHGEKWEIIDENM